MQAVRSGAGDVAELVGSADTSCPAAGGGQVQRRRIGALEGCRVDILDLGQAGSIGSGTTAPSAIDACVPLVEAGRVVGHAGSLAGDRVDQAGRRLSYLERSSIAIAVDARELPASADEAGDTVGSEERLAATDGEAINPGQVERVGLVAGTQAAIDLVCRVVPGE